MENWELIAKYLREEGTVEEHALLETWLAESEDNRILFEEARRVWKKGNERDGAESVVFDRKTAWHLVQKKIKEEQKAAIVKRDNSAWWTLRIAALLVIGFFTTWFILNRNKHPDRIMAVTRSYSKEITLADSSKIKLNTNSSLTYLKNFDETERRVTLEGEAFFDITKNPSLPFIIDNGAFEIKVLGTSFNVFAYKDQPEVILTVLSGTVSFKNTDGAETVVTKGERAVLNRLNKTITKREGIEPCMLAWKTRELEFKNTLMQDVAMTLKSYFGADVIIKDEKINNCRFTGRFDNPSLEQVIEILKNTLNIDIQKNRKQIVISGKGC